MIIGITGNSGSGKSMISNEIAQKINAIIIDADKVVKEMTETETQYLKQIIKIFGEEILIENKLNKNKLAEIIFNDELKREQLNNLTYKFVVKEIISRTKKIKDRHIIIDAPLLFESGLDKICNYTIGVIAKKEIKLQRICIRDNIQEKTALARLNIQNKDEFYIEKSDCIIENNGKLSEINLEEICTKIGMN